MDLSIVIPVFNEQDSLKALLEEIHGVLEGREDFEVLCVDDASDDGRDLEEDDDDEDDDDERDMEDLLQTTASLRHNGPSSSGSSGSSGGAAGGAASKKGNKTSFKTKGTTRTIRKGTLEVLRCNHQNR